MNKGQLPETVDTRPRREVHNQEQIEEARADGVPYELVGETAGKAASAAGTPKRSNHGGFVPKAGVDIAGG